MSVVISRRFKPLSHGGDAMLKIRLTALLIAALTTLFAYFGSSINTEGGDVELIRTTSGLFDANGVSVSGSPEEYEISATGEYVTAHQAVLFDSVSGQRFPIPADTQKKSEKIGFTLQHEVFHHLAREETLSNPRPVRFAVFQSMASDLLDNDGKIKDGQTYLKDLYAETEQQLTFAKSLGVNIAVLGEFWTVPLSSLNNSAQINFEDFAEEVKGSAHEQFISEMSKSLDIVIVSPFLERISGPTGGVTSAALVVDGGEVLVHQRTNQPIHLDGQQINSLTYKPRYTVANTRFGKIGVNLGESRHHTLTWMGFGFNDAEIVFAPVASSCLHLRSGWMRDATTAASSNEFFVVSSNRVANPLGGPEFFGGSFIVAPDGSRGTFMSAKQAGILIGDIDLNTIKQMRDATKHQQQARYSDHIHSIADLLAKA